MATHWPRVQRLSIKLVGSCILLHVIQTAHYLFLMLHKLSKIDLIDLFYNNGNEKVLPLHISPEPLTCVWGSSFVYGCGDLLCRKTFCTFNSNLDAQECIFCHWVHRSFLVFQHQSSSPSWPTDAGSGDGLFTGISRFAWSHHAEKKKNGRNRSIAFQIMCCDILLNRRTCIARVSLLEGQPLSRKIMNTNWSEAVGGVRTVYVVKIST